MRTLIFLTKKWIVWLNNMVILGVDPGLNATGYGVIEVEGGGMPPRLRLCEAGTINPKKKDRLPQRLATVYKNLTEIIAQYHPSVVVLEKLFAHYKHPATAFVMGHVRGVICLACAHTGVELEEHSVKRIRKAVLGNGNATKLQTRASVAHILKLNAEELTLDASDALALSLGYIYMQHLS